MTQEDYLQAKADLAELFQTVGWGTVKRILALKMREIEGRVIGDFRMTESTWRELQKEHALYERIKEAPMDFFLGQVNPKREER